MGMQVSKIISAVCALAFVAGFKVRADDTPAQVAARAAVEAKIRVLNTQQVGMRSQVQPSAMNGTDDTDAAERALHEKMAELNAQENANHSPASTTKAVVVPMTVSPASSEAQAQAQAALEQKMAELNAEKNAGMAPSSDSEAQASAQAALNQKMAELRARSNTNAASPASSEAQTQAQAALEQKMMELNQQQTVVQKPMAPTPHNSPPPQMQAITEPKPAVGQQVPPLAPTPPPAAATPYPGEDLGFKPIAAPPPPVSTSKEAQLHALLQQYMDNQITPDEYQKKRAEILDEPGPASH